MYNNWNLEQKMTNLTTVEDWFTAEIDTTNWLEKLFSESLTNNIFASIYIAIRRNPENDPQAATDTYDYYNIGSTPLEIAEYFNTRYSMNYFLYNYNISAQYTALKTRLKSIYHANLYKYKKLVELLGYRYNPLYNVDANELYSNMESIGDTKSTRTPEGTITSTSGTKADNTIGETTQTNYTNPYDQNTSGGANYVNDKTTQSAITTEQTYEEYTETTQLNNEPASNYVLDPQTGEYVKSGIFSVAAADSAFGVALGGAERYYAEKRIRQGNIGVTKSTELIKAQRDVVRFNILDEFFKDIEKDLIVGIY